ncbi:MAG: tyrosine-protein phosphatase [Planctomycetota bacterium]
MIDLHNHLLPGIDDGARKLDESLEFLRIAWRDGVRTVVATPHMKPGVYDNQREAILQRLGMVREAQRGDEAERVTLLPGAEVYFTADLVERARDGRLMTLADRGRYLLLELPYQQIPLGVEDTIFQLRLLGITPVMAHPERVAYYLEDIGRVATSVHLGALTQITGASVTGRFGEKARAFALEMLSRNLAHVLASDGHDAAYRPPLLSEAMAAAARVVGETRALHMVRERPLAILEGREVEAPEPVEPGPRGLLRRFRAMLSSRRGPG